MIGFNGGLIGKDRTSSQLAAVGVWTLDEQVKEQRNELWPLVAIQYRYVRWTITAIRGPGTDTQVADFNLRIGSTNISMSSAVVTIDPATASGSGSTTLSSLIDNNSATKWFTNITGTKEIFFDMGSATAFDGYRWVTGNDADGRDPVSWTVAGSVAGVNYTTLDTQTNFATTTSRQTVVGPFTFA
jgi:hypothetical protein